MRRAEERIRYFIPARPSMPNAFDMPSNDQLAFLMAPAKERWIFGGNRSGKTESSIVDCTWFCTGQHPVRTLHRKPPVFVRHCGPSYEEQIKGIILKKYRQFIKHTDLLGTSWSRAWSNTEKAIFFSKQLGSSIRFKSYEQDVDKYGGDDLDAVYADEHCPQNRFRENKMRLVDRDGYFVGTMTPEEGGVTWEKKHLRRRGDSISVWFFDMRANPFLSEAGVREVIEELKHDPALFDVKVRGQMAALSGMVIPQYDEELSVMDDAPIMRVVESKDNIYGVFAIDPHLKKPTAMVWACVTREGNILVYKTHKQFMTVDEIKKFVRVKSMNQRIHLWLGDEAQGGEGENIFGQESVLKQLAQGENALPIVPTNQASDKSFQSGIFKLREMFSPDKITGKPKIFIARNACADLTDELDEYQFIPNSKADEMTFRDRVRKVNDDCIDCLRYIAMASTVAGMTHNSIQSGIGGAW